MTTTPAAATSPASPTTAPAQAGGRGNHTPGPWLPIEDPMCNQGYKTLVALPQKVGRPGAWVAFIQHNWNDAEAGEYRISWAEAEANARLIATAPELLDALEKCVEAMGESDPVYNDYWQAVERAETIIAKARGQ